MQTRPAEVQRDLPLPRCIRTAACDALPAPGALPLPDQTLTGTTIAIIYGFERKRVRYNIKDTTLAAYLKDMTFIMRLVLSLRRVQTRLPIRLFVSGERHQPFEARLAELGVEISPLPLPPLPSWANPWHYGSFTKLAALSLTDYRRVIVLDVDLFVLHNIDHLAFAPAPAYVYRRPILAKCEPHRGGDLQWDINSGLMVLEPSAERAAKLRAFLNNSRKLTGDGGDQSVWRAFWPSVAELPTAYNTYKSDNVSDWQSEVFVLHDVWPLRWTHQFVRRAGWAGMLLRNLSVQAPSEWTHLPKLTRADIARSSNATHHLVCYDQGAFADMCDYDLRPSTEQPQRTGHAHKARAPSSGHSRRGRSG